MRAFLLLVGLGLACGCRATTPTQTPATKEASAPPAARRAPPALAEVGSLFRKHCVRCHDQHHRIDLRAPPSRDDEQRWGKIVDALEAGEMPPPTPDNPFPLDPAERQRMIDKIIAVLDDASTEQPGPFVEPTRADVWLAAVTHVADGYLAKADLDAIIGRHRGGLGGPRASDEAVLLPTRPISSLSGVGQLSQSLIAYEVCRAFVSGEAHRPRGERRVLGDRWLDGPRLDDATATDLSCRIARHVYEEECGPDEARRGLVVFRALERSTRSRTESAVAVCTAYLAGPRVFAQGPHARRGADEGAPR